MPMIKDIGNIVMSKYLLNIELFSSIFYVLLTLFDSIVKKKNKPIFNKSFQTTNLYFTEITLGTCIFHEFTEWLIKLHNYSNK